MDTPTLSLSNVIAITVLGVAIYFCDITSASVPSFWGFVWLVVGVGIRVIQACIIFRKTCLVANNSGSAMMLRATVAWSGLSCEGVLLSYYLIPNVSALNTPHTLVLSLLCDVGLTLSSVVSQLDRDTSNARWRQFLACLVIVGTSCFWHARMLFDAVGDI